MERLEWRALEMPPLGTLVNREAVIFTGAEPVTVSAKSDAENGG